MREQVLVDCCLWGKGQTFKRLVRNPINVFPSLTDYYSFNTSIVVRGLVILVLCLVTHPLQSVYRPVPVCANL